MNRKDTIMHEKDLTETKPITDNIFEIRGKNVMLDRDLAKLYNVTTGNLNKAVKRNSDRFPKDFMFQLTKKEYDSLVFQSGRSKRGGSRFMPFVFTEQGVSMLSAVLNSEIAIKMSINIMRAFVKLRQMILKNDNLRCTIEGLEKRVSKNERSIQMAINTLQQIIALPESIKKKKMGLGKD